MGKIKIAHEWEEMNEWMGQNPFGRWQPKEGGERLAATAVSQQERNDWFARSFTHPFLSGTNRENKVGIGWERSERERRRETDNSPNSSIRFSFNNYLILYLSLYHSIYILISFKISRSLLLSNVTDTKATKLITHLFIFWVNHKLSEIH